MHTDNRPIVVWGRGLGHVLHENIIEKNDDEMKNMFYLLFSGAAPECIITKITVKVCGLFLGNPGAQRETHWCKMHQSAKLILGFNSVEMIRTNELFHSGCSDRARKYRNKIYMSKNDKMEFLDLMFFQIAHTHTHTHTEHSFIDSINKKSFSVLPVPCCNHLSLLIGASLPLQPALWKTNTAI